MRYRAFLQIVIILSFFSIVHAVKTEIHKKLLLHALVRIDTKKLEQARAIAGRITQELSVKTAALPEQITQMRVRRLEIIWLLKRYFGNSHHI